jgi:hypothetical protein
MDRQFTETEVKAMMDAESILRSKHGLIVSETDGNLDDVTHNTNVIFEWYANNPGIPVTVATMEQVAVHLRDQLRFMSVHQTNYNRAYNALTPDQQNQFGAWWNPSAAINTIIREGDAGYQNGATILTWCRGKQINSAVLNSAVSNLVASVGLHLAAPREQGSGAFKPGHTMEPGETFMPKEPKRQEFVGGRKNHAVSEERKPAQPTPEQTPDAWKTLAENLRGATHSEDADLKSINGSSWRETYTLRKRYLARREGSVFNKTAV